MKIRIALLILFTSFAALACGLFAACAGHEHDFKLITAETEPTCTDEGWGLYRCDCGEETEKEIPAIDHDWGEWQTIPATCEYDGLRARFCKRNVEHVEEEILPAFGHEYGDWQLVLAPTCEEPGYEKGYCEHNEQHFQTRPIDPIGHEYGDWQPALAPTCEEPGYEECYCKHNEQHSQTRPIDPIGHDWGNWTVLRSPDCTRGGVDIRYCKNNSAHYEEITTSAPDPSGHDFMDSWTVISPATCLSDGVERSYCRNNWAHYEERTIPKLPEGEHRFDNWRTVMEATCTVNGYENHSCRDCRLAEYRTIFSIGHTFGDWQTVIEAGCAYTGKEERLCSACGYAEPRALVAQAHKYHDGVCVACGRRDWTTAETDNPDLYNSEYAFRALANEESGASMQTLYLLIAADAREYHGGAYNSSALGTYDYEELGLTFEKAASVWKAFMDDHPLYYWLGRTLYNSAGKVEILVDSAYRNSTVRAEFNQIIYKTANEWREEGQENAYLAALSYHDRIIYAVDYAYLIDGRTPQTAIWAHNIIGVFTAQGAVCEGYARSFQMLLNMTGIENIFVSGNSGSAAHAWNLVRLDNGGWYWFDLTYDDVPGWLWGVQYNYFAVNDTQNINWVDSTATYGSLVTFPDQHTPYSGEAAEYMPPLPERSQTEYKGKGELILRQTFTVGKFTYAVVGYRAVQLVSCTADGEVFIPEYVEFDGTSYEVISVGSMKENGLFGYSGDCAFSGGSITTLHIPRTIRYLFETARPSGGGNGYGRWTSLQAYDVDEGNQLFTSVDGVLFTKTMYTLIAYPGNSPRTEYYIPDNVVFLADDAFPYRCANLRSLTIGSGLLMCGNTNWGNGWLQDSHNGSHSIVISWYSEIYCLSGLEEIKVSEDNPRYSAENGMLFNKDKTSLITVLNCLEEVVVPSTVTVVEHNAFFYCSNMTRLVFEGDALQSIACAFGNNHNLDEIVFGGTRAQWDAVDKDDPYNNKQWDRLIGAATPDGTYTLTCLGDL